MCEISIIVPVYNVEQYLRKCVDSILAQTFTDFEVILVDDGSPDNSGAICDEYAKLDSRVRVIHKENGGLSDARNAGIEIAKGKYLGFVDSDDFIDKDMYEILYNDITSYKADISSIEIVSVYDEKYHYKNLPKKKVLLNQEEAVKAVLEGTQLYAYAWNKLYRREIFDKVRFFKGKTFEDAYIIIDILLQSERIVVSNDEKYFYLQRVDSIMGKNFSNKTLDVIEAWKYNKDNILNNFSDLSDSYKRRMCWAHFYVLDKLVLSDNYMDIPQTKQIISFLKENKKFILTYKGFTKSRKLSMLTLLLSNKWYKKLVEKKLNNRKY